MQVILNIEKDQLGSTVEELFLNLDKQQKESLSRDIIKGWFKDESSLNEYSNYRDKCISDLNAGKYDSKDNFGRRYSGLPFDDYNVNNKLEDLLKEFKNSKSELVFNIKEEIKPIIETDIKKWIKEAKEAKEIKEYVLENLKAQYPGLLKKAFYSFISSWISDNISQNAWSFSDILLKEFNKKS